jgi:hypothetical protein
MKLASTSALVLTVTLVLVRAVEADGLADSIPLYKPVDIVMLLQDENAKKALNIASYQEPGIKASLASWQQKQAQDAATIYKLKGPDKEAKVRALTARRAEQLFQSLSRVLSPPQLKRLKQILLHQWGIALFEHPEIRGALKISEPQAHGLARIHDELRNEIVKQVQDRRLTQQDALVQCHGMSRGIPDKVRAALGEEQRQILDDLLGAPHPFFP